MKCTKQAKTQVCRNTYLCGKTVKKSKEMITIKIRVKVNSRGEGIMGKAIEGNSEGPGSDLTLVTQMFT